MEVPFTDMGMPFTEDKWPCPFKNETRGLLCYAAFLSGRVKVVPPPFLIPETQNFALGSILNMKLSEHHPQLSIFGHTTDIHVPHVYHSLSINICALDDVHVLH